MNTKVRALIWEECRVSGVLALHNLVLGALLLVFSFYAYEHDSPLWGDYEDAAFFIVIGFPLMSAVLFVLGKDNTGHLIMGFPKRILHLPVHTHTTVAITLTFRMLFLLLLGFGLQSVCTLRFGVAPWNANILFIMSLYLLIQVFDWLRQLISGLASVLAIALLAILVLVLGNMKNIMQSLLQADLNTFWAFICICALYAAGLGVSIWAVRATRRGKRFGPPELWELPALWTQNRPARQEPFASPMDAAVWFERKRSLLLMPTLTLLFFSLLLAVIWIGTDDVKPPRMWDNYDLFTSDWTIYSSLYCAFLGSFLLASAGYGIYRGAFWRRRAASTQMIPYLCPTTTAEITASRMFAGALQAGMVLFVMGLLYHGVFLARYDGFAFRVFTSALHEGFLSWRELSWAFLSPLVLVGLVAWAFLWPSWLIWLYIDAVIIIYFFGASHVGGLVNILSCSFIIVGIASAAVYAWFRGLMSNRHAAWLFGAWLLLAWLVFPVDAMAFSGRAGLSAYAWLQIGLLSLALASLGPMPYIGMLLHTNEKRHSQKCTQNPLQHKRRRSGHGARNLAAVAGVVVFCLWLRWPIEPTWEAYLHQRGFPTTIQELYAMYGPIPDDENLALPYKAAWEKYDAYEKRLAAELDTGPTHYTNEIGVPISASLYFRDQLPYLGSVEVDDGPITTEQAQIARRYWQEVGKEVAPMLHTAAESGLTRSCYWAPANFMEQISPNIDHHSKVRALSRVLMFEAFMACMNQEPHEAAKAIAAQFPMAYSLEQEPGLISYLVSIAVLQMGVGSLEDTLKHISLPVSDLQYIDKSLPEPGDLQHLERAELAESVDYLRYFYEGRFFGKSMTSESVAPYLLVWQLAKPSVEEEIFLIHRFNQGKEKRQEPYCEAPRVFLSKLSLSIQLDEVERNPRTGVAFARIAIAIERYRLATGHFPEHLEELIPAYMKEVPEDPFAQPPAPMRYLLKPDGSCVIYSVSMDHKDDGGASFNGQTGDRAFTLLPPEKRTAVAPATNHADGA